MYDPNVCTPTMFEDELRALTSMPAFSDPEATSREAAVVELRKAIKAVREIPGWSGDSVGNAEQILNRMESNAKLIEGELAQMRTNLQTATTAAAAAASQAISRLPSASAEGFLADAGRTLSGITNGLGSLDTGELVAQEEAKLAAERETAAMNELKAIRSTMTSQAATHFRPEEGVDANTTSVPLPVIDVDGIDARVPPVGSNGPSAGGGSPQGGIGTGSVAPQPGGTWVPGGGGDGGWDGGNGGSGSGSGGSGGNGGSSPSVDSPNGGSLPGYPGIGGGGGGGGLLAGGSGGSGTPGAAVVGGAGAAALMGARSASLSGAGGAGLFGGGGSGAGAATAGRGLLGMSGATGPGGLGAAGAVPGSATGAAGGTTAGAGGRSMAPGIMGGAAGDDEKRRDRSGLGGPIAPKLEDDEETGPRSRSAQAGSRDTLR